jgi:hypothetical protein
LPLPLEVSIHTDGFLYIPLRIENPLDHAIDVNFSVDVPDGWKVKPLVSLSAGPHPEYCARVQADAPSTKLPDWQKFTVSGEAGDKTPGHGSNPRGAQQWLGCAAVASLMGASEVQK